MENEAKGFSEGLHQERPEEPAEEPTDEPTDEREVLCNSHEEPSEHVSLPRCFGLGWVEQPRRSKEL